MKAAEVDNLDSSARTDIVARILETAQMSDGVAQQRLSRDAYLSHLDLDEFLSLMTRNDLLTYDMTSKTYRTTRKGDAFLKTHRQMGEFIDLIEEEIGL
jgi:predicted transcriptional regulator